MAAATELLLDAKWWPMDSGSFSIMLMSGSRKETHFPHFQAPVEGGKGFGLSSKMSEVALEEGI